MNKILNESNCLILKYSYKASYWFRVKEVPTDNRNSVSVYIVVA